MMIGTAEDIDKGMEKIANIKVEKQWDFVIGIINLSNISDGQELEKLLTVIANVYDINDNKYHNLQNGLYV